MSNERKRPPRDWEGVVDKQIREAMERGEFRNLSGQGKPLDLGENPFTPKEWQLAFKILKDAGVSLDWIEQDKELRRERESLMALLQRNARWIRERAALAKRLSPDRLIVEHENLTRAREKTCAQFRERAIALNRQIDTLNLKMPISRLHQERIRTEDEIEKFLKECK